MPIDWGQTARDYANYRAGYPQEFFDRLARFGVGLPGQRVLDLGTGTGSLARGLALRGCAVTGLDPSVPLLNEARRLDLAAGAKTAYVAARAEATGLPDRSYDVVTAGTSWQWFDSQQALQEVRRLVVPGGRLVIARFFRLPLPGTVVEATERLIAQHNPKWEFRVDTGIHPEWVHDVEVAGFREIETFSFDAVVQYGREAWCGRIRASASVAASLSPEQVARFTADLKRLLEDRFPQDPLDVLHRLFAVVCRAP